MLWIEAATEIYVDLWCCNQNSFLKASFHDYKIFWIVLSLVKPQKSWTTRCAFMLTCTCSVVIVEDRYVRSLVRDRQMTRTPKIVRQTSQFHCSEPSYTGGLDFWGLDSWWVGSLDCPALWPVRRLQLRMRGHWVKCLSGLNTSCHCSPRDLFIEPG